MLVQLLIALVVLLTLCCFALAGFCVWLYKRQAKQALLQVRRDAIRDKRVKELTAQLATYLEGSVRMGRDLHELSRTVMPLPDRLAQLEQRDINNFSFSQAAKLVGMGASIDDLTQSCGLSQSEAELMSKLHQGRRTPG